LNGVPQMLQLSWSGSVPLSLQRRQAHFFLTPAYVSHALPHTAGASP